MRTKEILRVFDVRTSFNTSGTKEELQEYVDNASRTFKPRLVKIEYDDNEKPKTLKITGLSVIENPFKIGARKYLIALMADNGSYEILSNNNIKSLTKISAPKYKYYLVDAGVNPRNGTKWYDLIKSRNWEEASKIAKSKFYEDVLDELTNNFRESIGILVYDRQFPTYAIKPLSTRNPE